MINESVSHDIVSDYFELKYLQILSISFDKRKRCSLKPGDITLHVLRKFALQ